MAAHRNATCEFELLYRCATCRVRVFGPPPRVSGGVARQSVVVIRKPTMRGLASFSPKLVSFRPHARLLKMRSDTKAAQFFGKQTEVCPSRANSGARRPSLAELCAVRDAIVYLIRCQRAWISIEHRPVGWSSGRRLVFRRTVVLPIALVHYETNVHGRISPLNSMYELVNPVLRLFPTYGPFLILGRRTPLGNSHYPPPSTAVSEREPTALSLLA